MRIRAAKTFRQTGSIKRRVGLGVLVVLVASVFLVQNPAAAQTRVANEDGKSAESARSESARSTFGKVAPGPATGNDRALRTGSVRGANCVSGFADIYPCLDVSLQGHLTVAELGGGDFVRLNDLWGWHDKEFGRYYILIGRSDGTAIVDVTDAAPKYLGELPKTPGSISSTWRDIKVLDHYAVIVADGAAAHGMQVFDLHELRTAHPAPVQYSPTALYSSIASSHNIIVNEETEFAYAVGSRMGGIHCNGGLHMIDMADPLSPTFAGCYSDVRTRRGYTHDAQCVKYKGPDLAYSNREIFPGSN